MWFYTLIRQFFFSIDKVIFDFISIVYELLISISRSSILTQGDIAQMASRIYNLLIVFMVFKVTFSLIMYIVNPDDFSDKSKGMAKLGSNIIICLSLLILTPYIFRYAYELQTIIIEDGSLADLVFGEEKGGSKTILNDAGDKMAYVAITPFLVPNTSITELQSCVQLSVGGDFNSDCSGIDKDYQPLGSDTGMYRLTYFDNVDDENKKFSLQMVQNYVAGFEHENFGLFFRKDLISATARSNNDEVYVMEYRYIFSTAVGIIIVLMLINFCMDVALRSVKLSFLQLIAPIPIISYIDPKSGKDGMFKKWYQLCFKTYLSLFIRLLALYFAIYIIGKVVDFGMVDLIDGTYITNTFIRIFIIIGALMFAKQLPKILEGLGIKLDGDGKFNLNPLKKIEEQAIGGKRITGAASGALIGALGNKGNPFKAIGGAFRGFASDQGFSAAAKQQANVNKQLRQAKLDGSTLAGRMNARWTNLTGAPGFNNVERERKNVERMKKVADAASDVENTAIQKIKDGEAGEISVVYQRLLAEAENAANHGNTAAAAKFRVAANDYLNNAGKNAFIDFSAGKTNSANVSLQFDSNGAIKFTKTGELDLGNCTATAKEKNSTIAAKVTTYETTSSQFGEGAHTGANAAAIHSHLGGLKSRMGKIENEIREVESRNQADQKYVESARIKK